MPQTTFNVGDSVQVRSRAGLAWQPGTVAAVEPDCFCVSLATPIAADLWEGKTRRYGGGDTISVVHMKKVGANMGGGALLIRATP